VCTGGKCAVSVRVKATHTATMEYDRRLDDGLVASCLGERASIPSIRRRCEYCAPAPDCDGW
jgi:hypothetical protein